MIIVVVIGMVKIKSHGVTLKIVVLILVLQKNIGDIVTIQK
tara:strand:- start:77 stop:199 length:123 start_codon:yes stop_codon:yes gene_type:complete